MVEPGPMLLSFQVALFMQIFHECFNFEYLEEGVEGLVEYRREIDGLRAVALIPVILFHAGFKAFAGGFVGVDVFFVISGYLITSIILSDMRNGVFSIGKFYERRVRRIFPALFFVLLCCLPFAWLWLLPEHLENFYQSLSGVSIFSSNIFFCWESGYFETAAELKPLLHTWSLAVEEQYYLFFPIFIMLLWRLRKRWVFCSLAIVALVSIAIAQWGSYHYPAAAFFLLPTRGWELALGALTAFYSFYKKEQLEIISSFKVTREFFGILGLSLVAYSIFAFNRTTPFPGFYALLPTIGTVLIIIFSNYNTVSGRMLSNKVLVGIGLISYSAYLWHQPILAFARHRCLAEPSQVLLISLATLSIVLGYFSWRFIEKPFRDRNSINKVVVFKIAVFGTMVFGLFGILGSFVLKVPEREIIEQKSNFKYEKRYYLQSGEFEVALWGDSYAGAFAHTLGLDLNENNISLALYVKSGCPSIVESLRNTYLEKQANFSRKCYEHNKYSYDSIIKRKPKYVIIANNFEWYLRGKTDKGDRILYDEKNTEISPEKFIPEKIKNMVFEFKSAGIIPIIVTPPPRVGGFFEKMKRYKFGYLSNIYVDYLNAENTRGLVLSGLSKQLGDYEEVNGLRLFCGENKDKCSVFDEKGRLLIYDGSHITSVHAREISKSVQDILFSEKI